jgi:nucleoside-diphosphate-sugar epimerase
LKLANLLSQSSHKVYSIIRTSSQSSDILETGATPIVLSLENDSFENFTEVFLETQADVVYFAAGAGGKGGEERTRKVDYEGAVKIFDAIENVVLEGGKKNPRLVLVSAIDVRDPEKVPEHYVRSFVLLFASKHSLDPKRPELFDMTLHHYRTKTTNSTRPKSAKPSGPTCTTNTKPTRTSSNGPVTPTLPLTGRSSVPVH